MNRNIYVSGPPIWATYNEACGESFTTHRRHIGQFSGTSSATTLVARMVVLIPPINPNLTAREIKDIMQKTADKILDKDPKSIVVQTMVNTTIEAGARGSDTEDLRKNLQKRDSMSR